MQTSTTATNPQPRRRRGGRHLFQCGVVIAMAAGVVVLVRHWSSAVSAYGLHDWSRDTDVASAVLPIAAIALGALLAYLVCSCALYAMARAFGWARAAMLIGAVVVPRWRRACDRALAFGMLGALVSVGGVAGVAQRAGAQSLPAAERAVDNVGAEPSAPIAEPPLPDLVREPEPEVIIDRSPEVASSDAADVTTTSTVPPTAELPVSTEGAEATPTPSPATTQPVRTGRVEDQGPGATQPVASSGLDALRAQQNDRVRAGETPSTSSMPALQSGAVTDPTSTTPSRELAPEALAPGAATPPAQYTVVSGDNLWAIAAQQVGAARGIDAGSLAAADIAPYWVALIEANRSVLRSGNPNLIYPGEVFTLPAAV